MKIFIETKGDSSVGINGDYLELIWEGVDTKDVLDDYDDALDKPILREEIRKDFKEFFTQFLGEPAAIAFDDKCPDCGHIRKGIATCTNRYCPSGIMSYGYKEDE